MSVPDLFDPSVISGLGSGLLGLIAGAFTSRTGRIAKLEREVKECRQRDARVHILEAGVRLMVGEMARKVPDSEALRLFKDLMDKRLGPVSADLDDFRDLLDQLNERPDPDGL